MKVHQRVEYQVGHGAFGVGVVIEANEDTEVISVRDEDDGSIWVGLMDHAMICEAEPGAN